jgi:predicted nucleic acid-binding protein
LLDTDVFSQATRSNPHANVAAWLKTVDDDVLAISVLTVHERWKGVARAAKDGLDPDGHYARALQSVIDAYDGCVVSLDPLAAKQWGLLVGAQQKNIIDKAQAAIASTQGLILASRNVKD